MAVLAFNTQAFNVIILYFSVVFMALCVLVKVSLGFLGISNTAAQSADGADATAVWSNDGCKTSAAAVCIRTTEKAGRRCVQIAATAITGFC